MKCMFCSKESMIDSYFYTPTICLSCRLSMGRGEAISTSVACKTIGKNSEHTVSENSIIKDAFIGANVEMEEHPETELPVIDNPTVACALDQQGLGLVVHYRSYLFAKLATLRAVCFESHNHYKKRSSKHISRIKGDKNSFDDQDPNIPIYDDKLIAIDIEGNETPPMDFRGLKYLCSIARLSEASLVRSASGGRWVPLRELKEDSPTAELARSPVPAPPPQPPLVATPTAEISSRMAVSQIAAPSVMNDYLACSVCHSKIGPKDLVCPICWRPRSMAILVDSLGVPKIQTTEPSQEYGMAQIKSEKNCPKCKSDKVVKSFFGPGRKSTSVKIAIISILAIGGLGLIGVFVQVIQGESDGSGLTFDLIFIAAGVAALVVPVYLCKKCGHRFN